MKWLALALVLATSCGGKEQRMDPDQQIYFVERCKQAGRRAAEAPEAERDAAIDAWVAALREGNSVGKEGGLCRNELHDALVTRDDRTHRVALEAAQRLGASKTLEDQLLASLASAKPEERARARAALAALTDQDLGEDRAAWTAWLHMPSDQLAALRQTCGEARKRALEGPAAERDAAIASWADAIRRAKRHCAPYDDLVADDDARREIALEVVRRVGLGSWQYLQKSLTHALVYERTPPEQRARAAAALKVLTGQDFGLDAAAWQRWFAS